MAASVVRRVPRDSDDDDDDNIESAGDKRRDMEQGDTGDHEGANGNGNVNRSGKRELIARSRRDPMSLSLRRVEQAGLVTEVHPVRDHHGEAMTVSSQVSVGIDQRICIAWSVPPKLFAAGYRLLGYRRTDGFPPEEYRRNLSACGTKIVEARTNAVKEELLPEGEYFYTFLLYSGTWHNWWAYWADVVQFSELMPSAKYAIERMKETYTARKLERKLLRLGRETAAEEGEIEADQEAQAAHGAVDGQRSIGTDFARLLAEQNQEIEQVKTSAEWKRCKKHQRRFILAAIRNKYRRMMGMEE